MTERPQLRVAKAITEEERWRVFRFRYQALVEDQNVESSAADHENRLLYDAVDDDAMIFYMTEKSEIIATVRLASVHQMRMPASQQEAFGFEHFGIFPPHDLVFASRFISARAWRTSPALAVLFGAIYKFLRDHGVRLLFLNSPPAQIRIFERLGYRRLGANFRNESGYQVPLVMLLDDILHLEGVASPLRNLAQRFKNRPDTANWFAHTFPNFALSEIKPNMSEDDFWAYLTARPDQIPIVSVPLLEGLSHAEAKKFLNVGTILQCQSEDRVIRAGDRGDEMFVLLSGQAQVRTPGGESLALLEKGDVFGELGFLAETPRTANIVALTDLEVLILTQEFFRKVMESMPEITIRVLFNLSVVLCSRLKLTTESLVARTDEAVDADGPPETAALAG